MPPKRKSTGSHNDNKRVKTEVASPDQFKQFYASTLKLVHELRDDTNERQLTAAFIKVPSKKLYPDYTQIVTNPICISDIQKKFQKGKYSEVDVSDFLADFKLILDNAALYNEPGSWVVEDATKIYEFVKDQASQFVGSVEVTNDNLPSLAQTLLEEVINYEFPDIGVISGPFMDVISKKDYPDYFAVIKRPTSFNKILDGLDEMISPGDSVDENLDKIHEETLLIFTNAQTYNDPASLIYQDSLKLQELFEAKFNGLKAKTSSSTAEPSKPKVTIKLKPEAPVKKRGRPKLTPKPEELLEPEQEEEEAVNEPEAEIEDEEPEEDEEEEIEAPPIPTLESNVMGRTQTLGSTEDVFIKDAYLASSTSTVSQVINQTQEFNNYRASQTVSRYQLLKDSFFPKSIDSLSTLMEFKFPSNGYCSQSYTVTLPADALPFLSLRFNLHNYLYSLVQEDLRMGQRLSSDEEFQCKLFANDEEVVSSVDVDNTSGTSLLRFQYDIKLCYGLNVISFECKVAPPVAKVIKKTAVKIDDSEEIAGRHTRHQLQQMKRSWEVEKFTFFVMFNNA